AGYSALARVDGRAIRSRAVEDETCFGAGLLPEIAENAVREVFQKSIIAGRERRLRLRAHQRRVAGHKVRQYQSRAGLQNLPPSEVPPLGSSGRAHNNFLPENFGPHKYSDGYVLNAGGTPGNSTGPGTRSRQQGSHRPAQTWPGHREWH